MTTFNRIFMLLLGLIIFAFGTITFLLLSGIVVPGNTYLRSILALYNAWRAIVLLRGASTNIALLISLGLMLVGLVLVILELLPVGRLLFRRRESKLYVVRDDPLGQVTLEHSVVRDLVRHEAESVTGVVHAEPDVKDAEDGLHIGARVTLAWGVDTRAVGQLLQEQIAEAVKSQLGLLVAQVQVTVQAAPAAKDNRRHMARVA